MLRCRKLWLAVCFCAIAASSAYSQDTIRWAPNLPAALTMASRQNQLVLVHFWAPGCGPCMALERNVFSRPEVAQALARDFVAVKINAEAMPETARKYKVDRWPMDVVITPAGYPLHSMVSPQDPNEYMQTLYRVAAQRRPGERISANTAQQPADAAANLAQGGRGMGDAAQPRHDGFANQQGQPQMTDNRFAPQGPSAPRDSDGWGGQASRFGPTYGDQVQPPVEQQNNFAPSADQPSQFAPRDTVNPYVDNQPPAAQPRGGQGFATQGPPPVEQRPVAPQQPRRPPLGLDGYCPVSLSADGAWTKGDERFGIIHRGRLYLFATDAQKQTFWQDPDRYAPILSGNDAVTYAETGKVVQGSRRHGVFFRNQIFLFTSEESLQRFWNSPQRYADIAVQAMARASAGGRQMR